jgi:cell division protein FtsB
VKPFAYVLIGFLVLLQYPLWFGSGGALAYWRLQQGIDAQQEENARLQERNRALQAEVVNLKSGLDAIEERARAELGMVKRDETFYQVVTDSAK